MTKPMRERGYTCLDIETGILPAYGRKASPFYSLNDIWAVGYGTGPAEKATGFHRSITGIPDDWFRRVLDQNKLIVGHNLKFDLLHLLEDSKNHTAWMQWVSDGGQIWDTQLAEYLLQGQDTTWQMASLEDVSALYGGSMKDDAVKGAWVQGIDTGEIDPDVLLDYLLGTGPENLGDIGNTALVFKAQFSLAKERGQLQSITLNNGALLYCVESERNGMYVDVAKGEVIRKKLVESLDSLNEEVNSYLPKDLPFTFNWGSAPQKSALLFGGEISYSSREHAMDENGVLLYAKKDETLYITNDGELVTEEWVQKDVSNSYKLARFAGGAKKGEAKTKKVKVDDHSKPKMTTVKRQYSFPGYVKPLPQWESKSTPGQYSTGSEVTDTLGTWEDAPPFVKAYAERAKVTKDLGTYYWTEDRKTGERKGMLSLVGPDGVVHGQLNMVNTNTGRLSASSPNLQNLPKEGKSEVKTLFISRFPGGSIVQSDFSALEVYVQANLSKDSNLISDLRNGLDMHCMRVSQKEGVTYEYVVERAKDPNHPEHKLWAKKRSQAKGFSFARAYGAGAASIAAGQGMDIEEVKALIEAEEARYPGVTRYNEATAAQLIRNRRDSRLWVQSDHVPGVSVNLGKSWLVTPGGKRYTMYESQTPSWVWDRERKETTFSPTTLKNYPIQGEGAEWMKAAMWLIVRAWYARGNFAGKSLIVNTVHDAAYIDAAPEVAMESMALLHACMLSANELIQQHFSWDIAVHVPAETSYGPSMADESKGPAGWDSNILELQQQLFDQYIKRGNK